jgi:5-methylcytosine-specific restriction endonuclease McrA
MRYREYISSVKWKTSPARLGELEAAGFRCRTCFDAATEQAPLEVHHRTYARFGRELVGDLTALCRPCHRTITDTLRRRRYSRTAPKIIDAVPSIERSAPLFDPAAQGAAS